MLKSGLIVSAAAAALMLLAGPASARGSWITLYSSNYFNGPSVTLYDDTPDLDAYHFGDRPRSARVHGTWLMCASKFYDGECVTLDEDIADLKAVHMSRRANSVRPRHHHHDGGRDD